MDEPMADRSWIRATYLYLAALIGLVLVVVGSVRLVDLGLRSWVFPDADEAEAFHARQPPMPFALERVERLATDEAAWSPQERAAARQWLDDHARWREQQERFDPVRARRQRTAASSLALILIGLPLYLYHWRLVRRGASGSPRRRDPPD